MVGELLVVPLPSAYGNPLAGCWVLCGGFSQWGSEYQALNDLNHSPSSIAPPNKIITILTFTSRLSDRAAIAPATILIDAASMRVWLFVM